MHPNILKPVTTMQWIEAMVEQCTAAIGNESNGRETLMIEVNILSVTDSISNV